MTTKFTLTLPDKVASDLERWAVEEGRNKTNLGNYLVEAAVRHKYPEEYPPPDAYTYGLKGVKRISAPDSKSDIAVLDYLFGEDSGSLNRPTETQIVEFCSRRNLLIESVTKQVEAKAKEHR